MVAHLFSILHASARPHKWREIYDAWMKAAVHPENVEYVLCVDDRWGFELPMFPFGERERIDQVVRNTARRCYVDSVNIAAKASTGRILIVIADDQYPSGEWDMRLTAALSRSYHDVPWIRWGCEHDFVIQVSTGTPNEHDRGMIVMPILSRARYERLGYVFYPEYESMYADNDFYEHAQQDGCIIDARHLMFPHRHPIACSAPMSTSENPTWDEAYAAQNRPEAYVLGERVLVARRATQFRSSCDSPSLLGARDMSLSHGPNGAAGDPLTAPSRAMKQRPTLRGSIALALPGENFSGLWVAKLLEITMHLLQQGWNYCTVINYTSNPGITRQTIWKQIQAMGSAAPFTSDESGKPYELKGFDPDYILWIDDDQIVETGIVDMLITDMEALPDADVVAGWTWIASNGAHFNEPQVSCGRMNLDKGELSHAEYRSVQTANGVFEVHWTGFPVLLMRPAALKKAGKHPFAHLPCPDSPWGECGEDISFCKRLRDAGGKIYVDSRAFVPHMKQKALGPSPESKDEIALALSGKSPILLGAPMNFLAGDREAFERMQSR